MKRLLSVLGNTPAQDAYDVTPKRFTRFEPHTTIAAPDDDKNFTRFPAPQAMPKPTPIRRRAQPELVPPAPRPAREVAPVLQQSINAMDHLNSEADIPLSILRKALPRRFAEMQGSKDDDEIAAFFS